MDTEKIIKRIQMVSLSCDLKTDEGIRHFHHGHEYVEIGGLKWATMNVGAEKPTDYGLYFQWGDTQGYTADQVGCSEGQKRFEMKDYKYGDRTSFLGATSMTKYNKTDGKKVLDLEDDAVRVNWRGSWRMPTNEEMESLRNAVSTEWRANYNGSGVNGFLCTDKTDSSKKLFFLAAGHASSGCVYDVGSCGFYWLSSLYTFNAIGAWDLGFSSECCNTYTNSRCFGFSVRGVVG